MTRPIDETRLPNPMPEQRAPVRRITYAPPAGGLNVIHVDDDILVAAKPSGLLSVPGRGPDLSDSVASRALAAYPGASIVHRLDLDTSGVMVLARNRTAHRHLSRQFEQRQIGKVYIARVWGNMRGDHGLIDAKLICDWPNRPRQMIDEINGKAAVTNWQVIEREPNAARVRLNPQTGRSHQLRVHMLSIGHPIIGDNIYAHDEAYMAAERLQLHAQSLTLRHPADERELAFENVCPF
jgi:tRNA pseudouridine32 synthase/23S rRNA pseudouridine746 synthase